MKKIAARLASSIQVLSADSVALIISVGLVLGTFPVYGCPTVMCLLAVLLFRLNAPALHLVNQLVSPLQLALIVPFARLGEQILGSPDGAPHSILSRFGALTLQAVTGWLCVGVPFGILIYFVLCFLLRRYRQEVSAQLESPA